MSCLSPGRDTRPPSRARPVRWLTTFSTSSRRPHGGRCAPPPKDGPYRPPLRFAPLQARPLAWRAHDKGGAAADRRSRHTTAPRGLHALAGYLGACSRGQPGHRMPGLRIAPLAIMGSAVRHGTRQGRPPAVASDRASSTLDPHRTEPEVGSYRGDVEDCASA
jgi:hypothetical protein